MVTQLPLFVLTKGTGDTLKDVDSKELLPNEGDIGMYKDPLKQDHLVMTLHLITCLQKEFLVRKLEWDSKKLKMTVWQ